MKVVSEPVMSDVVRSRLGDLLNDAPRHAESQEGASRGSAGSERYRAQAGAGEVSGEEGPLGVRPPSRADSGEADGLMARVGEAGRRAREFARGHLAAVLLVLVVGCGWTVYSLLQARSSSVAVAAAASSVVASPTETATPVPRIFVHVLGAVRSPGVVELPDGSRVLDAITAAGGFARAADPGELNLAAVVADGSQIIVGTKSRPSGEVRGTGSAGSTKGESSPAVSLNSATLEQLDGLPGIGPVTAQKILDWREKNGRFTSVNQLLEVDGIGPKTLAEITPKIRV